MAGKTKRINIMKVELEKIVLGHSELTDTIFAGIVNPKGLTWRHKVDVTDSFYACVISRFGGFRETIECPDGKEYEIIVKEIKKKKKKKELPEPENKK